MNVDQAYDNMRNPDENPRDAFQWAIEHWEEASGRLLSKLRALSAKLPVDRNSPEYDEADAYALYVLIHLFAEQGDTRAYAPLCDRLARDIEISAWLDDPADGRLNGVLISLFDGELEPLQKLMENVDGDKVVRSSAFEAYSYLVRTQNAASEEDARGFLLRFLREARPRRPDRIWTEWALAVARLGFADLGPEVARLFSKDWINSDELTLSEYHGVLAEARADPAIAFSKAGIGPCGSAFAGLDEVFEGDADIDADYADEDLGQPYVNTLRDVGRNDPCPCGSGKKFKKCCLAA